MIDVLDKGYVRLVDSMGSDITVVNSARVSYNKSTETLEDRDKKLISFLAREGHTSPFRHGMLQFEIYAPLMVARQWWKYVVGSDHIMDAWNETSRRYVTEDLTFYIPDWWRSAPENSKQGSGENLDEQICCNWTSKLNRHAYESMKLYEEALAAGICAEQARLFLPAYSIYVRWYWTASLASVAHLLNQRLAHDAQKEFQLYASAVHELASHVFPHSIATLVKEVNK